MTSGLPLENCVEDDNDSNISTVQKNGSSTGNFDQRDLSLERTISGKKVGLFCNDNDFHYNRWLTDRIKKYLLDVDDVLKFLFEPYTSFSNMDKFFGLSKSYIYDQRVKKNCKTIISKSVLDKMQRSLENRIHKFIKDYPDYQKSLLKVLKDLINIITEYKILLEPKPSPKYQMYNHHPNFDREYFSEIDSKEKAYWLGFLFADVYIVIQHLNSGDYYRMGLDISEKDLDLLLNFCLNIGLDSKNIRKYTKRSPFTDKEYSMVSMKWGDQRFANDLINLGMNYIYDKEKERRVKEISLPPLNDYNLMLAFLLGFYDGDGSLGLKNSGTSIYPTLISSGKKIFLEIKEYFEIKNEIYEKLQERLNIDTGDVTRSICYSLYLGIDILTEMLKNYQYSLKRKRVEPKFFELYNIPVQRRWLLENFNINECDLGMIFKIMSPNRVAQILNVSITALKWILRKKFNMEIESNRQYYTRINRSFDIYGSESSYYKEFQICYELLKEVGTYQKY